MTPFFSSTKTLDADWHMAMGPSAIYCADLDQTIVTWQAVGYAGNKNVMIAAYDHDSSSWVGPFVAGNFILANDNHGQPAICRDPDGYFYIFYGSHASPQLWSVSTVPSSIEAWSPRTAISGAQSYPHPIVVGGSIYLFTRNDSTLSRRTLSVRIATPSGGTASFTAPITLVDFDADSRAYQGEAYAVGTKIHFVCSRANSTDTSRKGVYYFVYDTTTGAIENHDGSVVVGAGSLPISLSLANSSFRLFDHGAGQGELPSLCFDSTGAPHIIVADNGGSGSTSYTLKHMTRAGGVWSSPLVIDSLTDVLPGVGFTSIYGLVPGPSASVEAWYMNAAGDKVRRVRDNGGNWAVVEPILIATTGKPLMGHQAVRNGLPSLRTVFSEVSSEGPVDSLAIESKRYAYGDSGFLAGVISLADGDPLFPNVSLLLGFEHRDGNAAFINDAETAIAPASVGGNAQVDSSPVIVGLGHLLLDGSVDYVQFAHNTLWSVGNGDFCCEAKIVRVGSKLQCIATKRPSSGSSEWGFYVDASDRLFAFVFNTSVAVLILTGTTALIAGTEYDVALDRSGNVWKLFLNGVLEAFGTESAPPSSNTAALYIGRDPTNSARDFSGRIDEFRFTSGASRYPASYTPVSGPFPRKRKKTLSDVTKCFNVKRVSDGSYVFVDGSNVRQDLVAEQATDSLADLDIRTQITALRDAATGTLRDELDEALKLAQS